MSLTTHILGHIVEYEPMFDPVIDHMQAMEKADDPELEQWFNKAKNKGRPIIKDVPRLRSDKKFTLRRDTVNGRYFIEEYRSSGWL